MESFPPPPCPIRVTVAFWVLVVAVFVASVAVYVAASDAAVVTCFPLGAAVALAAAAGAAPLQAASALVVDFDSEVSHRIFGEKAGLSFSVSSSPLSGQRRGPFQSLLILLLPLSSVMVVSSHSTRGTASTHVPRIYTTSLLPLPASFFHAPSAHWGSRQSSGGSWLRGEQAMPDLLSTALTSSTCPYLAKGPPSCLH